LLGGGGVVDEMVGSLEVLALTCPQSTLKFTDTPCITVSGL